MSAFRVVSLRMNCSGGITGKLDTIRILPLREPLLRLRQFRDNRSNFIEYLVPAL